MFVQDIEKYNMFNIFPENLQIHSTFGRHGMNWQILAD